jgi:hypothetical protein
MSAPRGFLDLPGELRFMIYRLLFCPPSEPILVSFPSAGPLRRSAQLLRVCRSCHKEASSVLYGDNQFALDYGTESSILEFFENVGPTNRLLIRHLKACDDSIRTLEKLRTRRSLRPTLENLDSLSVEFFICYSYESFYRGLLEKSTTKLLHDVQTFLKTQRGPYQKLTKTFQSPKEIQVAWPVLRCRLVCATAKPELKVCNLAASFQCPC